MKRLNKSEEKHLYPFLKAAFIIADIILIVFLIRCIFVIDRFNEMSDYIFIAVTVLLTVFLIYRTCVYFKVPYKSVPGISNLIDRKKLTDIIESEDFKKSDDLKKGVLYEKVYISDRWFEICGYFVPRNLIAMMWLEEQGLGTQHFYVNFCLITGDVVRIKYLIRDRALKKDIAPECTDIGVKATLMRVLQKHTKGIGVKCNSQVTGNKPDQRLVGIVLQLAGQYNVRQNLERLIYGNGNVQELIAGRLKQEAANLAIETWESLWDKDERYKSFIN